MSRLLATPAFAIAMLLAMSAGNGCAATPAADAWDAPHPPFHIAGNTWYVGTGGVSVILVRGEQGSVLFDAGTASALPVVLANLDTLGVAPQEIDLILTSHVHEDHVGALAELKARTGARVLASAESALLLSAGGRGDLHYGDAYPYAPVMVDDTVLDGETITLGKLAFTAHLTPGHTPGSTSWTWTEDEGDAPLQLVYADSLSAPGYRLLDHPHRPGLVEEFRRSFAMIRRLPCDVLLTPHPQASGMFERFASAKLRDDTRDAPIDSSACRRYADRAEAAIDKQIASPDGQDPE